MKLSCFKQFLGSLGGLFADVCYKSKLSVVEYLAANEIILTLRFSLFECLSTDPELNSYVSQIGHLHY